MDRSKTLHGIGGAQTVGGGAKGAGAPKAAPQGSYKRANGAEVPMASMNPHHRAAAARKAELAGDTELARALRASGTVPE